MHSPIVKDSSVWYASNNFVASKLKDTGLRLGIVKRAVNEKSTGDIRYLVEIRTQGVKQEVNCRYMRRFGGAYNFEDMSHRGYKTNGPVDSTEDYKKKAGDLVIVAFLEGHQREGIILGGLTHPARKSTIDSSKGPQYKSEFNGIEQFINSDGEYIVTFKGQPTNLSKLTETPSAIISSPSYDAAVGSSFYKFDKTGSWTVSDNAKSDKQFIKIDKKNGTIEVAAGKISLKMTKKTEAVSLTCKLLDIVAEDKITAKTKELAVDASDKASIKSPKVAIGKEGVELLDQLAKLVDALAKVIPISPVGPCSSLMASPQWSGVEQVKAKIKEITGTF